MKIAINSQDLRKVLDSVLPAVPQKTATPILENILVKAEDGTLTLTASDEETTIVATTAITDYEAGTTCIPARLVGDLVKLLPSCDVTIETAETSAKISWENGNSSIPIFPAEDYPTIAPVPAEGNALEIPFDLLKAAFDHAIYATSNDDLRPVMGGIYFNQRNGKTDCVASDSHILSLFPIEASAALPSFILPAKSAGIVKGLMTAFGTAKTYTDGKLCWFVLGATTLVSRLIVGKFPKYETIIPKSSGNVFKADRVEFIKAIKRVSVCSNKASGHIKFTFTPEKIVADAQDLGFGVAATEVLAGEYGGEPITIGFKAELLLKIANSLAGESIEISMTSPRGAALVTSEGDVSVNIIMPIQVQ